MSIKTHYALRQNSETDNSVLVPLTSVPPIAKAFFPFDEGSGTTVTDLSSTGLVFDNGDAGTTIAWAGPANSATITQTNGAPNSGTVPDVGATESCLLFCACQSSVSTALLNCNFGANAVSARLQVGGAAIAVEDGSANIASITVTGLTIGEDHFLALILDRATNTLKAWYGDNASLSITSTPTSTADASAIGAIATADQVSFGAIAQHYYSCGLLVFSDGVPSDYVSFLQELQSVAFSANPALPARWVSLT